MQLPINDHQQPPWVISSLSCPVTETLRVFYWK